MVANSSIDWSEGNVIPILHSIVLVSVLENADQYNLVLVYNLVHTVIRE